MFCLRRRITPLYLGPQNIDNSWAVHSQSPDGESGNYEKSCHDSSLERLWPVKPRRHGVTNRISFTVRMDLEVILVSIVDSDQGRTQPPNLTSELFTIR